MGENSRVMDRHGQTGDFGSDRISYSPCHQELRTLRRPVERIRDELHAKT
jgi:hypothetical protein